MRYCRAKTKYYVSCRWTYTPGVGGSNFICTPSLGKARYWAKKLKLKNRQIDVRTRGRSAPYVLEGSWL